jgi:hypothetical protein
LNQWLALTPPELVQAHLKLDPQRSTRISFRSSLPELARAVAARSGWLTMAARLRGGKPWIEINLEEKEP